MSNYNGQFQDSSANILLGTPHSYGNIEGETASQAYVKGQMVVYNNRLCEIIATVSQGDTFTIGTNIAYKNVGNIGEQLVASDGTEFYFDVNDGKYGFYPNASKQSAEFVPFGGSIDLTNAVDLNPGQGTSCIINNALDYSLIIATGMGSHEYVTGYVNITTTDPTTNKFHNNVGAHYTGSAATLVYVPSVNTATIREYSNAQVMQMGVYGII